VFLVVVGVNITVACSLAFSERNLRALLGAVLSEIFLEPAPTFDSVSGGPLKGIVIENFRLPGDAYRREPILGFDRLVFRFGFLGMPKIILERPELSFWKRGTHHSFENRINVRLFERLESETAATGRPLSFEFTVHGGRMAVEEDLQDPGSPARHEISIPHITMESVGRKLICDMTINHPSADTVVAHLEYETPRTGPPSARLNVRASGIRLDNALTGELPKLAKLWESVELYNSASVKAFFEWDNVSRIMENPGSLLDGLLNASVTPYGVDLVTKPNPLRVSGMNGTLTLNQQFGRRYFSGGLSGSYRGAPVLVGPKPVDNSVLLFRMVNVPLTVEIPDAFPAKKNLRKYWDMWDVRGKGTFEAEYFPFSGIRTKTGVPLRFITVGTPDFDVTFHRFPFPLEGWTGKIIIYADRDETRLVGMQSVDTAPRILSEGLTEWDPAPGIDKYGLVTKLKGLYAEDPRLILAMQKEYANTYEIIESFSFRGPMDATFRIAGEVPDGKVPPGKLRIVPRPGMTFSHEAFPYRFRMASGISDFDIGTKELKLINIRCREPEFGFTTRLVDPDDMSVTTLSFHPDRPIVFGVQYENAPLNGRMRFALAETSKSMDNLWDALGVQDGRARGLFVFRGKGRGKKKAELYNDLKLQDVSLLPEQFPRPFTNLSCRVIATDYCTRLEDIRSVPPEVRVSGSGYFIHGSEDEGFGDLRLSLRIEDMPLDERLRGALPEPMRKIWDEINPTGKVDADCRFSASPDGEPQYSIFLTLGGGTCKCGIMPPEYRIRNVSGTATLSDDRIEIHRLAAKLDEANLLAFGSIDLSGELPVADITLRIEDLHLTPRFDFETEILSRLIRKFSPDGKVDVVLRLKGEIDASDPDSLADAIDGEVIFKDLAVSWDRFPEPITALRGTLKLSDGRLTIDELRGRCSGGDIFIRDFSTSTDQTRVEANVEVRGFHVDKRTHLSPGLTELANTLDVSGTLDLRGKFLATEVPGTGESDLEFSLDVWPRDFVLHTGLRWDNVSGRVHMEGSATYDNVITIYEGDINIVGFRFHERHVSRLYSNFTLKNNRLIFTGLDGEIYGGKFFGVGGGAEMDMQVTLDPDNFNYGGGLFLRKASVRLALDDLGYKTKTGQDRPEGEIKTVALSFFGNSDELDDLRGTGEAKIRKATLIEVPLFSRIFSLFSFDETNRLTFDEMNFEYEMRGDVILLKKFTMISPILTLKGDGKMDFDGHLLVVAKITFGKELKLLPDVIRKLKDLPLGRIFTVVAYGRLRDPKLAYPTGATEGDFFPPNKDLRDWNP
jgi:hypothetical protein